MRRYEPQTKKVLIHSITGQEFEALLLSANSLEHLIYDSSSNRPVPPSIRGEGIVYSYLCLRKIDPNKMDPVRLIDLLKRTAKIILFEAYYQDIPNFDEFWHELEQTDQLDIEIAQDTIIQNAFGYIPMLGLSTHESFHRKIHDWDEIGNREVQARQNAKRKGEEVNRYFEKEREKLREDLKTLLESTGVEGHNEREELLSAIRYKIGQEYQYKRTSILFELFQNADDAVAELGVLLSEPLSRKIGDDILGKSDPDDEVLVHLGINRKEVRP